MLILAGEGLHVLTLVVFVELVRLPRPVSLADIQRDLRRIGVPSFNDLNDVIVPAKDGRPIGDVSRVARGL